MTYRISRLGWLPDPPDHRDQEVTDRQLRPVLETTTEVLAEVGAAQAAAVEEAPPPSSVNLREYCSPIEDQQDIGSCTAQAICGLAEYLQRTLRGEHIEASRLFLYKATRQLLGWTGDTGAFVRSAIKALRLFGVPPEDYWPYDTLRFDDDPGSFCYAFAGNYKAIGYYRLHVLDELKESLARGTPFAFGFVCYDSLFTEEVSTSGDIPFPTAGDRVVGGHAVMAVGYDDPGGRLLIRNSWGTGWGDAGYGSLGYEYVERGLAQDFWALADMEIVELKDSD
jgi:C1A family cysteine protease